MEPEDCLQAGTLLRGGKYRIVKAIGQGGFGITYKAKYRHEVQEAIGKMIVESDVAIKEFFIKSECERADGSNAVTVPSKKKAGFIEDYRKKFFNEANNLSRFNHENIVKVIDIFEENSTAYFVMEYIDGESLDSIVEKRGAMSELQAKEVIGQLAKAVDYIHRNKFSHFDIKPANILVNESGCLKLVDFGLAKHYDSDGKQTSLGVTQGVSEGFSPVEQYKMGSLSEFSPRTDIYSVGATMAYLLTGKVPPSALDNKLPALPSSVSDRVKQGIYAAMANAIEDRPKTIGEFMQMIGGKLQPQIGGLKAQLINGNNGGSSYGDSTADPDKTKFIGGGNSGGGNSDGDNTNSDLKYWIIGGVIAIVMLIFGIRSCKDNAPAPTPEPVPTEEVAEETNSTSGYINGHEWVDLGLPSGLKWATCNVGASSPEQDGYYFAWGEISPKLMYTEENCKYLEEHIGEQEGSISYRIISGNPEYDAARANWGGTWRMPMTNEFDELFENCVVETVKIGKVYGIRFKSKINSKSIFIPNTGYKEGTSLYRAQEFCAFEVWTANSVYIPQAIMKYCFSGNVKNGYVVLRDRGDCISRHRGLNIRAVTDLVN